MNVPKVNWSAVAQMKRKDGSPLISGNQPVFHVPREPRTRGRKMRRTNEHKTTSQTETQQDAA